MRCLARLAVVLAALAAAAGDARAQPRGEVFDAEIVDEVEDEDGQVVPDETAGDGEGEPDRAAQLDEEDGDGETETIRIDDDLDDVGADVDFGDLDDEEEEDGRAAVSVTRGTTRLEAVAMSYARIGVDAVHDRVPEAPDGIDSIGEDVFSFRLHGRAEGTSRFGDRVKVKAAGRVNLDLGLDTNTHIGVERYEADVWDTYADVYTEYLDLRVGNQIVAWGVADLLSPNDVVNPRDLRRGFAERPEELRRPVLAASATFYAGPFSLQGLYIPVAPRNRFELIDGDYAVLGPNAATPVERRVGAIVSTLADDPMVGPALQPILAIDDDPGHGIETGEAGASASVRLQKIDFHGYVLWFHERSPRIAVAEQLGELFVETPPEMLTAELIAARVGQLGEMGIAAVEVDYPRKLHVGGAVATRIEPFGLKLEAGYSPNANAVVVPPGGGPILATPMELPQLGATLSLDYDRGNELTVVLEAAHVRTLDVPAGRAVFQMDGDQLTLLGTRVSWTPRNGPLSFRLLTFLDVTSPSYAIRPAVRLSGHDNLSVELAAGIYGGPPASWGGTAEHNDEVFVTFQYGL